MLEAVGLDDVDGFELSAEFPAGKSLLLKPDDVGLGQVDEQAAGIFSEGHFGLSEFEQEFGVGGEFFHGK